MNIDREKSIESLEENSKTVPRTKRGRKPKHIKSIYKVNKDQTKFFVDLSKEKDALEKVFSLLEKANKKTHGREITFKDLALFGIDKINSKDIERVQELSLSKMEKVEKALDDYNKKNGTNLGLADFLVKKLSIN